MIAVHESENSAFTPSALSTENHNEAVKDLRTIEQPWAKETLLQMLQRHNKERETYSQNMANKYKGKNNIWLLQLILETIYNKLKS